MSQWVDTRRLRIGMAQINTTAGDFDGNRQKILEAINKARSLGAQTFSPFPNLPSVVIRLRTCCLSHSSLLRTCSR